MAYMIARHACTIAGLGEPEIAHTAKFSLIPIDFWIAGLFSRTQIA